MDEAPVQFRVVITGDAVAAEAMEILSDRCRVVFTGPYPSPEVLAQTMGNEQADALLIRTGKATAEVMKASPRLRVIAKHGVGYDNIDTRTATDLRIPVLISATANYQSVAEHALALMLSLAKQIPWLDARMRQGMWDKTAFRGDELFRKTLGLVGFGRIGRRVCELVTPLEMNILVYEPFLPDHLFPPAVTRVARLEELLRRADIVSLHCPLVERTRNLIDARELEMMKRTAWLINTARGGIINEEALIAALRDGKIAAAGLDTFQTEPPEDVCRLIEAGRVVLTPHTGAATREAFIRMGVEAAQNIMTVLTTGKPDRDCLVNPEILTG
ncbi:MAG: hydroxyacid dehydrogenase [Deltaproteobacteria bacterium]|nr:hydroxyacid dehydrogenase [Deltaproteobacteria bacterium]